MRQVMTAHCGHSEFTDTRGMPDLCLDCQLNLLPEHDPAVYAYFPVGDPTFCAGCGTRTAGTDLCLMCDDAADDPHRSVRR